MNFKRSNWVFFLSFIWMTSCNIPQNKSTNAVESPSNDSNLASVSFKMDSTQQMVSVFFDGQLFTSYLFSKNLTKPVLFPLKSKNGTIVTRGYPLTPRPNERTDHPHHLGHWLNYGDVNGIDFWNNSGKVDPKKKDRYGVIRHQSIEKMEGGLHAGTLTVKTHWQQYDGTTLIEETTSFIFEERGSTRFISRKTTLTAQNQKIDFKDNKEGMIAIRTARELEFPSKKPLQLTNQQGEPMSEKTMNNEGVNGQYLSSTDLTGRAVWGTRARWMQLSGDIQHKPVALAIIDHPNNVGYPTYWHARDYGLFSANPLGQKVFSKGKEELNFSLLPGESVAFHYQIVVHEGQPIAKEKLNEWADTFAHKHGS